MQRFFPLPSDAFPNGMNFLSLFGRSWAQCALLYTLFGILHSRSLCLHVAFLDAALDGHDDCARKECYPAMVQAFESHVHLLPSDTTPAECPERPSQYDACFLGDHDLPGLDLFFRPPFCLYDGCVYTSS